MTRFTLLIAALLLSSTAVAQSYTPIPTTRTLFPFVEPDQRFAMSNTLKRSRLNLYLARIAINDEVQYFAPFEDYWGTMTLRKKGRFNQKWGDCLKVGKGGRYRCEPEVFRPGDYDHFRQIEDVTWTKWREDATCNFGDCTRVWPGFSFHNEDAGAFVFGHKASYARNSFIAFTVKPNEKANPPPALPRFIVGTVVSAGGTRKAVWRVSPVTPSLFLIFTDDDKGYYMNAASAVGVNDGHFKRYSGYWRGMTQMIQFHNNTIAGRFCNNFVLKACEYFIGHVDDEYWDRYWIENRGY